MEHLLLYKINLLSQLPVSIHVQHRLPVTNPLDKQIQLPSLAAQVQADHLIFFPACLQLNPALTCVKV